MKNFWIFTTLFYFTLSLINQAWAQSDTMHLHQAYSSFSNSEKAEWTSFENNWNYFEYSKIKKNYKVSKLNCKSCTSFYADLYLEVDEKGKVILVHFMKGKICGIDCDDEMFIELFENSIKKQKFNYLKNKSFIARFGHILKC